MSATPGSVGGVGTRVSGRRIGTRARVRLLRVLAWSLGLAPLALLVHRAWSADLGADPIELLTHRTGWWALALLLVTLAVTPLRRLTGVNELVKIRRPLGLFSFFYATLHLLVYFVLDQGLAFGYLLEDILERPFITIGFVTWLLLLPLAVTSTRGWIRRLGRGWTRLHRLAYVAAALGVAHFAWGVKADLREPMVFALILLLLLAVRRMPVGRRRRAPGPDREGAESVAG